MTYWHLARRKVFASLTREALVWSRGLSQDDFGDPSREGCRLGCFVTLLSEKGDLLAVGGVGWEREAAVGPVVMISSTP